MPKKYYKLEELLKVKIPEYVYKDRDIRSKELQEKLKLWLSQSSAK